MKNFKIILFIFISCFFFQCIFSNNIKKEQELKQEIQKFIFDCLSSKDRNIKIETIKAIGELKDILYLSKLKSILKTEQDEEIKLEIINTLIKFGDNTEVPFVIKILQEKPNFSIDAKPKERVMALKKEILRIKAAKVIAETKNKEYINILKKIISDKNDSGRVTDEILISLYKLGYEEEPMKIFLDGLNSNDRYIKLKASEVIGELKISTASYKLYQLLKDPDKDIRAASCLALAKIGDINYVPAIRELLLDKSPIVRINACKAIGLFKDSKFIPQIKQLLKDENGLVKLSASIFLMQLNDYSYDYFLFDALDSTDFDAKILSLNALSELGKLSHLNKLKNVFIKETNPIVKINISKTILKIFQKEE